MPESSFLTICSSEQTSSIGESGIAAVVVESQVKPMEQVRSAVPAPPRGPLRTGREETEIQKLRRTDGQPEDTEASPHRAAFG